MTLSQLCQSLHERLASLRMIRYPFSLDQLPENGIYFFYEDGELWGHGGERPRIVRVGTHKEGNFRTRVKEHFLIGETELVLGPTRGAPKDRSIFRKNIGRALLNRSKDDYLRIWEIDFMKTINREKYGHLRDIEKEQQIESEVTQILRQHLSFRFIPLEGQSRRMGKAGLESRLIATLAGCGQCKPSASWLGNYSPKAQIRDSGLWLVQHLSGPSLNSGDWRLIEDAVSRTITNMS